MFYNDKGRNTLGEPNKSKCSLANDKAYGYMRQELVEPQEEIDNSIYFYCNQGNHSTKYNYLKFSTIF